MPFHASDQDSVVEKTIPDYRVRVNRAFTLAEVLITLGIIGVVAAMTIPTLIANYEKKVTSTGLRTFHSIMAQAYQLSTVNNGLMVSWQFPAEADREQYAEFFDKYFRPYLQISGGYIDDPDILEKFKGRNMPDIVYTLQNGVQFNFRPNNSANARFTGKSIYLIVDINGNKGPDRPGRDIFYLNIFSNNGVVWFGRSNEADVMGSVTREDLISGVSVNEGNDTACCTNDACGTPEYQYYTCGALIQMDGWQIKKDYPW